MHLWNHFEGAAIPVAVGQGSCLEDLAPRLALPDFPEAQSGVCSLHASCGKGELARLQSKRLINKMRDQISKGLSFVLTLVSHLFVSECFTGLSDVLYLY